MIRVYLADDHTMMRDGLKRLISETPDLAFAGETARGREALEAAGRDDIDVLVLDLSFQDLGGIEVLRRLRETRPTLPVVVLSMYSEEQYALRVLRMGAHAYLSKGRSSAELLEAIRAAARGARFIPSELADVLLSGKAQGQLGKLSEREHQVFSLIANGRTPGEIAAELDLSSSTVSTHLVRIREKLGLRTNGEIVQYAYRSGLATERS